MHASARNASYLSYLTGCLAGFFLADSASGFAAGRAAGFAVGRVAGFAAGRSAGFAAGRAAGFAAGRSAGFAVGRAAGVAAGLVAGLAAGGSAVDAEVVSQIIGRSSRTTELDRLTPRELDVLGLMAQGLSNGGIAERLVVSLGAVEKHISNVFSKLDLDQEQSAHRRVLAVLTYLAARP